MGPLISRFIAKQYITKEDIEILIKDIRSKIFLNK